MGGGCGGEEFYEVSRMSIINELGEMVVGEGGCILLLCGFWEIGGGGFYACGDGG